RVVVPSGLLSARAGRRAITPPRCGLPRHLAQGALDARFAIWCRWRLSHPPVLRLGRNSSRQLVMLPALATEAPIRCPTAAHTSHVRDSPVPLPATLQQGDGRGGQPPIPRAGLAESGRPL